MKDHFINQVLKRRVYLMNYNKTKVVILAAGKGTRMKSERAKVMHEIFFAPMLQHVLKATESLELADTIVVTGHQADEVEEFLAGFPVNCVRQEHQLGTAHAVLATRPVLSGFSGTILILCGDTPLIKTETLNAMLALHEVSGTKLTVMTTNMSDPANYGRILANEQGHLIRIIEEKDATVEERKITEINAGVYCVDATSLFKWLQDVNTDNQQGEFYLTDLVGIARSAGYKVERYCCKEPREVLGVNSRLELAEAHRELQSRRNNQLMMDGVTIIRPESVEISPEVSIGPDTVIRQNVTISGATKLGRGCWVGSDVIIKNCRIGDRSRIGEFSILRNCDIAPGEVVEARTSMIN